MTSEQLPRLSIIIPVHNREKLVLRTLESVERQTLRPLKLILVDNGSTDGTLGVLREWRDAHASADFTVEVACEPQPGACAARNKGLAMADTEFTMFFDSDDTMAPEHARRALDAFESPSRPDIAGWDVLLCFPKGSRRKTFHTANVMWHNLMHGSMATQVYAARTELFRRAGGWNSSVMAWNDIELGARLLALAPRIEKVKGECTVSVHFTEESITGARLSAHPERRSHALDVMEGVMSDARHRRWVRLRRAHLAGIYAAEGATDESRKLLDTALGAEPRAFYRLLLRATARLTAHRIPGALRAFRVFF